MFQFTSAAANVQAGWHLRFVAQGLDQASLPFQTAFIGADCSVQVADSLGAAGAGSRTNPTPIPTMIVITLQISSASEPHATRTPSGGLPTPRSTSGESTPWEACAGTYLSRLHIGDHAYVSYYPPDPNRVRQQPNTQAAVLGKIYPGEEVIIVDGPACARNWVWWEVRSVEDGLTGWTSEGDSDNYWLVPNE